MRSPIISLLSVAAFAFAIGSSGGYLVGQNERLRDLEAPQKAPDVPLSREDHQVPRGAQSAIPGRSVQKVAAPSVPADTASVVLPSVAAPINRISNGNAATKIECQATTPETAFDAGKLSEVHQAVFSDDLAKKHDALHVLAKLGSDQIKPDLIGVALDENEDGAIRREMIESINWHGSVDDLAAIIERSDSADVRLAAISAIDKRKLDGVEIEKLEQSLLDSLKAGTEDGVKIAILNYFAHDGVFDLESIVNAHKQAFASPEIMQHIQFLQTPPEGFPISPEADSAHQ